MIDEVIRDVLRSHLGTVKPSPNGFYHRNCPMCALRGHAADKRLRFGIKYTPSGGIRSNCFNCNFSAHWESGWDFPKSLGELMTVLGVSASDIRKIKFEVYRENNGVTRDSNDNVEIKKPLHTRWKKSKLLDGMHSLEEWVAMKCNDPDFKKVLTYAYSRGIRDFSSVYWYPAKEKQYNRRLIFPFTYNNRVVGWTGRYYGTPRSKTIPKYLNIMPEAYLYNLDPQRSYQREYVILTEGMMDAYFVDGIGALHNNLNEEQIKLINSLNKKVVLCPDRDSDGDLLIKIAVENKWYVSFPRWEWDIKDPSDSVERYGRVLTIQSILMSATNNPVQIEVNRKLDKTKWRSDDEKGKGKNSL